MMRNKVLVVDDEAGIRFGIRKFLVSKSFEVFEAACCQQAEAAFQEHNPDVAIIDYLMPDGNALELLPKLKALNSEVPVLILTAHGSIDLAVKAIKEGAEQFLSKPIELPALLVILERLLDNQRNRQNTLATRRTQQTRSLVDPLWGSSPAVRQLAERARRIISSDSPVLVLGETGTGKGVMARWLHENSRRANEAFIDLNCAGLTREFLETELFGHEKGAFTGAINTKSGLFEVAHRGTVFLDEIGDVDPQIQPKLLKVLEEKRFRRLGSVADRQVDVRLIAATHQDLAQLVQEKKFRSDLYFRISTIPLVMPALRERREDIPELAHQLLQALAIPGRQGVTLAPDAQKALQQYSWPGNIRELRNVLERALLLSDSKVLTCKDLPFDNLGALATKSPPVKAASIPSGRFTLADNERHYIEKVLQEEQGRVEQAAKRLGVSRNSLYLKVKKYGIQLDKLKAD
jgi:DNA-binding NtrC family response regulator